jgi:Zinc knuckle
MPNTRKKQKERDRRRQSRLNQSLDDIERGVFTQRGPNDFDDPTPDPTPPDSPAPSTPGTPPGRKKGRPKNLSAKEMEAALEKAQNDMRQLITINNNTQSLKVTRQVNVAIEASQKAVDRALNKMATTLRNEAKENTKAITEEWQANSAQISNKMILLQQTVEKIDAYLRQEEGDSDEADSAPGDGNMESTEATITPSEHNRLLAETERVSAEPAEQADESTVNMDTSERVEIEHIPRFFGTTPATHPNPSVNPNTTTGSARNVRFLASQNVPASGYNIQSGPGLRPTVVNHPPNRPAAPPVQQQYDQGPYDNRSRPSQHPDSAHGYQGPSHPYFDQAGNPVNRPSGFFPNPQPTQSSFYQGQPQMASTGYQSRQQPNTGYQSGHQGRPPQLNLSMTSQLSNMDIYQPVHHYAVPEQTIQAKFSAPKRPMFNSGDDPIEFLEKLSSYCSEFSLNPRLVLDQVIPSCLENIVREWYRTLRPFWTTLSDFEEAFRDAYFNPRIARQLAQQATTVEMGETEDPCNFVIKKYGLLSRFHSNLSEAEKLQVIIELIHPYYSERLHYYPLPTVEMLVNAVLKIKKLRTRAQTYVGSTNHSDRLMRVQKATITYSGENEPTPKDAPIDKPSKVVQKVVTAAKPSLTSARAQVPARRTYFKPSSSNVSKTIDAVAKARDIVKKAYSKPAAGTTNLTCWKCGKTGHFAHKCPDLAAKQQTKEVLMAVLAEFSSDEESVEQPDNTELNTETIDEVHSIENDPDRHIYSYHDNTETEGTLVGHDVVSENSS